MLFGEHTVIKGGAALALPATDFFGIWQYASNEGEREILQQNLPLFHQYLSTQGLHDFIDLSTFEVALLDGLYFSSNIPTGYGLGSSGALCAAILDKFGKITELLPLLTLKELLAKMESFFHGASSGTDPLVSYINSPLLLKEGIYRVKIPPHNPQGRGAFFLLDTGIQREANQFINGFLDKMKVRSFNRKCQTELIPLVEMSIDAFLVGNWDALYVAMDTLSIFQFEHFDFMIPPSFRNIWQKGLDSHHFKLKICGAGGGGFLLGFSKNFERTKEVLKDYSVQSFFQF